MKINIVQPTFVFILSSLMGDIFLQSNPPLDPWYDIVGRYGVGGILALFVYMWKRNDDQLYQKTLQDLNDKHRAELQTLLQKTDQREEKLVTILSEAVSVMTGVTQTLDQLGSAQKILVELEELRKTYAASTAKPRSRSS